MANGGPDRVVQPQDTVRLNGMASADDNKELTFQWKMLTSYPFAVIEVRKRAVILITIIIIIIILCGEAGK